jgi:hypothetical protein
MHRERLPRSVPLLSWQDEPERRMVIQGGPRGDEALQGLEVYEQMVDTFAENAKLYWRMWSPQGELMIRGIDAWTKIQRAYVQWVRQSMGNLP